MLHIHRDGPLRGSAFASALSAIGVLMLCLGLFSATPALAHKGHAATIIGEVDAKGRLVLEVRMMAHDAEPALSVIAPTAQPSFDDPDALKAFIAYVGNSLKVGTPKTGPVKLRLIQSYLMGDDVRLTYEGEIPGEIKEIFFRTQLLANIYPDQVTEVIFKARGVTRSTAFFLGDPVKPLSFIGP